MKVITHDGRFHADEVFAIAAISLLNGDVPEIIRTRDEKIIQGKEAEDIVVDVGGMYDPDKGYFDHHQSTLDVEGYASAGLVWGRYGADICRRKIGDEDIGDPLDVALYVYENMIREIDAVDNGKKFGGDCPKNNLSRVIGGFNRLKSVDDSDKAFLKAIWFAGEVLDNAIEEAVEVFRAKSVLDEAESKRQSGKTHKSLLILPKFVPWCGFVSDEVKFVVFPDAVKPGVWVIQGNRDTLLPREWWGLNEGELDEVVGVSGCVFCHKAGFIMACREPALYDVLKKIA